MNRGSLQKTESFLTYLCRSGLVWYLEKYPEWDSNPQQAGFEPTASASWAIGALR